MIETTSAQWQEAAAIIESTTCGACDGPKKPKFAVCSRCWFRLPTAKRNPLYSHVTEGFLDRYREALEFLKPKVTAETWIEQ